MDMETNGYYDVNGKEFGQHYMAAARLTELVEAGEPARLKLFIPNKDGCMWQGDFRLHCTTSGVDPGYVAFSGGLGPARYQVVCDWKAVHANGEDVDGNVYTKVGRPKGAEDLNVNLAIRRMVLNLRDKEYVSPEDGARGKRMRSLMYKFNRLSKDRWKHGEGSDKFKRMTARMEEADAELRSLSGRD